jgi:lysozyme family protein
MADFKEALPTILRHEGGSAFTDNQADPGGATKYGISLRFLKAQGHTWDVDGDGDVDAADVRQLTEDEAASLYLSNFWDPNKLGDIQDQPIATKVLDLCVNMGNKAGVRVLQRALCAVGEFVTVDGTIGPATLGKINSYEQHGLLLQSIRNEAVRTYNNILEANPGLEWARKGFMNRAWS